MTLRRRTLPALATALALTVGGIAVTVSSRSADAASSMTPIIFGAAAANKSEIQDHERVLGRRLQGVRVYKDWNSTLFGPDQIWARDTSHILFLSIKSKKGSTIIPWRDIANAQTGSQLHSEMLGHARQITQFRAPVFITFNHEPEAGDSSRMGTGADFIAAWRKLISTYRQAGVTNAQYTWNMTAWGFARTDAKAATNYYPGDAYVDHIAADAYNWYACRGTDWRSLASIIEAHRRFGQQHPTKGLMLYEWSSTEDPGKAGRKATWFREATQLFKQTGYGQYKAVLQWSGRNNSQSCGFDYLTSASATTAWRDMGNDPAYLADSFTDIAGTTTTASTGGSQSTVVQQSATVGNTSVVSTSSSRTAKRPTGTTSTAVKSTRKTSRGTVDGKDAADRARRADTTDAVSLANRAALVGNVSRLANSGTATDRQPSNGAEPPGTVLPTGLALLLLGTAVVLHRWRRSPAPSGAHRRV